MEGGRKIGWWKAWRKVERSCGSGGREGERERETPGVVEIAASVSVAGRSPHPPVWEFNLLPLGTPEAFDVFSTVCVTVGMTRGRPFAVN